MPNEVCGYDKYESRALPPSMTLTGSSAVAIRQHSESIVSIEGKHPTDRRHISRSLARPWDDKC